MINSHPARNIDLDLLVAAFKLPAIDALVPDPDLHAAVRLQVTWIHRSAHAVEVGRSPDDEPADIGGQTLRDHVLRHCASVPDTRVVPVFDDVDHTVVDRELDLDLRVPFQERGHHRSTKLGSFRRYAQPHPTHRHVAKAVENVQGAADLVEGLRKR